MNSFEFIDNKCFNKKNVLATVRVVGGAGVSGVKPQNGQLKVFLTH